MTATALRALLSELVDYAGLFPPATLSMGEAVANYATYRESADAWALARFVVPVVRLAEFEQVVAPHLKGAPWRLSVLAQACDADAILAFNARHAGRICIEAVETRAATVDDMGAMESLASAAAVFVEIPVHEDPDALVQGIAAHGLRAKVRTGGVTADAFPRADEVARFLISCARHAVSFKATAGLHHPLRGEYPLTYATGAPTGTMFGFLNVLLAAAFARRGLPVDDVAQLLQERDPAALRIADARLGWRGHSLSAHDLADDRAGFALSFGSCSFREPLDDLSALNLT